MSNQAFVFLYLNIGGEMVYIVQNRLRAQNICPIKSSKVLNDILIEMFNEKFLEEIFQCNRLPNHFSLKQLLTKLVHCSIMKLNDSSMNKLFDLIIMVFKYQLSACINSTDLIQITLNHLHSLNEMTDQQPVKFLITLARNRFLNGPGNSHSFKLQITRQALLNYLIGMKIRISVLLRIGVQCENGRFKHSNNGKVACHCQLPGQIRQFNTKGLVESILNFSTEGHYECDSSLTTLGFNIYEKEQELIKKFENESKNDKIDQELDDKNNKLANNLQFNGSKFCNEAQLLAEILNKKSIGISEKNENKNLNISDEKRDAKFWLDIDLELNELDKLVESNSDKEKNNEVEKSSQVFKHQQLENKENENLSKVNLLKIEQQMVDIIIDSNKNELDLLELLDNEKEFSLEN